MIYELKFDLMVVRSYDLSLKDAWRREQQPKYHYHGMKVSVLRIQYAQNKNNIPLVSMFSVFIFFISLSKDCNLITTELILARHLGTKVQY